MVFAQTSYATSLKIAENYLCFLLLLIAPFPKEIACKSFLDPPSWYKYK